MQLMDEGFFRQSDPSPSGAASLDVVEQCILNAKSEDEVQACVLLLDEEFDA